MDEQTLCDLCDTFIYSDSVGDQQKRAEKYIFNRLGYPDKGSNFDRELGKLKYLFRIPLVSRAITSLELGHLKRKGYDALMLDLDKKVIGHTAFQVHGDNSLHIFSVEVLSDYQEQGLARYMVEAVLVEARKRNISRMRIAGGKHEATNSIYQNFAERADELGIVAHEGNWIEIIYQT